MSVLGFILALMPLAAVSLLAFPSTLEMDLVGVTKITPFLGRFGLTWEEIRRVEVSPNLDRMVFHADGKRLPVPGPVWWAGRAGKKMRAFLEAQVRQREIEMSVNSGVRLVFLPSNARVK